MTNNDPSIPTISWPELNKWEGHDEYKQSLAPYIKDFPAVPAWGRISVPKPNYGWPPTTRRVFRPTWWLRWELRKLLRKVQRWLLSQVGDDVTLPEVLAMAGLGICLFVSMWLG